MPGTPLPERKSWQALRRHYDDIAGQHLRDLFAGDPGRGERLTAEAAGLYLDYSKNRVTDETLMCSPRNMASRRSGTPDSSASATSSRIVSSVTRFLE